MENDYRYQEDQTEDGIMYVAADRGEQAKKVDIVGLSEPRGLPAKKMMMQPLLW